MSALAALPPDDGSYEVVVMLTPSRAVDLFLGDLQRKSRSKSGRVSRDYGRNLDHFCDHLRRRRGEIDVGEIEPDDCRGYLNTFTHLSRGYQHTTYSQLNSFFRWLLKRKRIKSNPLDDVPRPRRIRSEDLDVTTVSSRDVPKLLAACRTVSEQLCVAILAYMGPRRNAVAGLRLSDYDRDEGLLRFYEKGSKTIWKPVPDELAAVLESAIRRGALVNEWQPDDPYLVPPEGQLQRAGERDDRVIWRIVKRVAEEAGVPAHVHALRAAFAVHYLETHDGDLVGLQELMGHESLETTRIYLRKLNKRRAMEPVRRLSWAVASEGDLVEALFPHFAGEVKGSSPAVGAGGFEPPNDEPSDEHRAGSKPERLASDDGPARPRLEVVE